MKRCMMMALLLATGCGDSLVDKPPSSEETGDPSDVATGCEDGAPVGLEVGMCAPEFTLPDSEGLMTSLSAFRGKVALVDIAALW